jgi:hypothetical protein
LRPDFCNAINTRNKAIVVETVLTGIEFAGILP